MPHVPGGQHLGNTGSNHHKIVVMAPTIGSRPECRELNTAFMKIKMVIATTRPSQSSESGQSATAVQVESSVQLGQRIRSHTLALRVVVVVVVVVVVQDHLLPLLLPL